jgi:hypothetical protein
MSVRTTAISLFRSAAKASFAAPALNRFSPQLVQDRLVAEELGWLIVDEEDVDRLVRAQIAASSSTVPVDARSPTFTAVPPDGQTASR